MSTYKLALCWALVLSGAAWGNDEVVTASDWRDDCRAYVDILAGEAGGDDLDVTYCIGQSQGIVEGLRTGSRIGAVGMASSLTVTLGLDRDEVFAVFQSLSADRLLGICRPDDAGNSAVIRSVWDYLEAHPDKAALPVTALFFEALQDAYPCAAPEENSPAAPGDHSGVR